MVITLTPDLEQALREQAFQQGTSPEQLALASLRERFIKSPASKVASNMKGSMFEYLSGYIAVLHSSEYVAGGAQMSKNTGKRFAKGMLKKREQGRL